MGDHDVIYSLISSHRVTPQPEELEIEEGKSQFVGSSRTSSPKGDEGSRSLDLMRYAISILW